MEKNKLRLLVVEDEKKLCDMIAKSLHQAGYEVDTCNDGEEALAQEKNIELIQKSQNSSDGRSDGTEESLLVACSVNSNEKPEDELILTGSDILIYRMIYNLVENAIKYNKECGEIRVWVGSTLNGKKIIVTDTGIGIPKEHQDRIFERFYRVDKSHSKERGGTGLGLSIVKHGAILHGAKVQVDSEYGKGTRMEIVFPEK